MTFQWPSWFSRTRAQTVAMHLAAWLAHLLLNNLLLSLDGSISVIFKRTLITYTWVAVLFYVNVYLIADKTVYQKRYGRLLIYSLLLILGYSLARYFTFYSIFPLLNIDTRYTSVGLLSTKFWLDTVWIALQYLFYSYGYWFALHKIRLEREQRILSVAMTNLDKAKVEAELAFLQAQVNPHFLFNTFNFLYSEAIKYSDKLADAVLALTSMMRMVTDLSSEKLVPLNKELEYLHSYIKIQQYRFDEQLDVTLEVNGEDNAEYVYTPPLLFTTLVENIFKHGDIIGYPIIIRFDLDGNRLVFFASNRKKLVSHPRNEKKRTGLGLANLKNQLSILYKDRHEMKVVNDDDFFSVELTLIDEGVPLEKSLLEANKLNS